MQRLVGPCEPLEELRHEVRRHTGPSVLDREPEGAAPAAAAHDDRRLAVFNALPIRLPTTRSKATRSDTIFCRGSISTVTSPSRSGARRGRARRPSPADGSNATRPASVPSRHARGRAAVPSAPAASSSARRAPMKLDELRMLELVAAEVKRRRDPVHDGDRGAQLVRRDRHDLVLQLVDPPQLVERPLQLVELLRLRDEDAGHEADRREQIEIFLRDPGVGSTPGSRRKISTCSRRSASSPASSSRRRSSSTSCSVRSRSCGGSTS